MIAPSGAVPREAFLAGAAILGERYELVYGEDLFSTDGYFAGNDARRLQELEQALGDIRTRLGDPALGEKTGRIDPARIAEQIRQLTDIGILTAPVKVTDVLDDEFLPADVRVKPAAH